MGDSGNESDRKGQTMRIPRPVSRPPSATPPSKMATTRVQEPQLLTTRVQEPKLPAGRVHDEPPASQRWEGPDSALAELDPVRTVRMPFPPASDSGPVSSGDGKTREIDLVVVNEHQLPAGERRPWRAAEIWTRRRVYGLDSTFTCVEILDRATGKPERSHEMLGARLGGGRLRETSGVRFSYPLPLPGMEAMFTRNKKHGYTSAVERVVLRVRVLHTSADDAQPSWEEIASRWSDPPKMP